ncbi:MAG: DUF2726 domain-containing protein [Oceanospirillaceae bacterium]
MLFDSFLPKAVVDFLENNPLMDPFLLIPIGLALLLSIIFILKYKNAVPNKENPFQQVGELFSPVERSFYGLLCQAVSGERKGARIGNALVLGKVTIAEVLAGQNNLAQPHQQKKLKKLAKINFDFVICQANDLSVIAVIELEPLVKKGAKTYDKEHANNTKRIQYLSVRCKAQNLPFHHFKAASHYDIEQLVERIFT